jgi:uncharacterized protein YxjI
VLEAPGGEELFTIQEKKLSVRDKMEIERDGRKVATIKKALVTPLRDRYSIEIEGGPDLEAKGNIVDHEYEFKRDGDKIAEVSKRWFRPATPTASRLRPAKTTRSFSPAPSASTRWHEAKGSGYRCGFSGRR